MGCIRRINSMNYGNTNRARFWPGQQKEKDAQPDFKGSLNVKGEEFWISAWKKKGGENNKAPVLSFSVQPKDKPTIDQAKDYIVITDSQSGV